jgi:AcrR family transcriptional regulator
MAEPASPRTRPDDEMGGPRPYRRPAMSARKKATFPTTSGRRHGVRNSERTKADILAVATREFAAKGLSGARIDEIAARTKTSKLMIYYHFGGKEKLYVAVIEDVYRRFRNIEHRLDAEQATPEQALRNLVAFTFDHHHSHPDYIRLVMNENLHRGRYLKRSKIIQRLGVPAIEAIRKILERGVAAGTFRPGIDPVDLHMSISALCFFNVSNRHTFGTIFKKNMASATALAARKAAIADMIVSSVKRTPQG